MIQVTLTCKAIPPGPAGNNKPRLVPTGPVWDEWDLTFCVHGEKLRWTCDCCDEHFEKNPKDAQPEEQ